MGRNGELTSEHLNSTVVTTEVNRGSANIDSIQDLNSTVVTTEAGHFAVLRYCYIDLNSTVVTTEDY